MLKLGGKMQFCLWFMTTMVFAGLSWTSIRNLQASEDTVFDATPQFSVQTGISGPPKTIQGEEYCLSYRATDGHSLSKRLLINWGESLDGQSDASVYESDTRLDISAVCHRYSKSGIYYWSASFHNESGLREVYTGYVDVEPDAPPSLLVLDGPVVSGNYLTAKVYASDDKKLSRVSFTLSAADTSKILDYQSLITVDASREVIAMLGNAWGFEPDSRSETTQWKIDISSLPAGRYAIEFFTFDQVNAFVKSEKHWFNKQ